MIRAELSKRNRGTYRTALRLGASLDKNLISYAAAAGAAGVGLLALGQPAEAKIVYTPAHVNVGASTFIDLNHDGINDFQLVLHHSAQCVGGCTTTVRHHTAFGSTNGFLGAYGVAAANQLFGGSKSASALVAGVRVGPRGKFPGGKLMAGAHAINGENSSYAGAWAGKGTGVQHRFLGLKFTIHGKTHFGWARLNVTISQAATIVATLTGYAYETTPGKPIVTGKTNGPEVDENDSSASVRLPAPAPASLGILAQGFSGLLAWRKRDATARTA